MSDQDVSNSQGVSEELPEWARDQITKANKEAARYRVERNEAVEAAKKEVSQQYESRVAELEAKLRDEQGFSADARRDVERLRVTIQAGIDSDKALAFSGLLQGENEDELRSHADELKRLFSVEPAGDSSKGAAVDPSQGSSGSPMPLNGDPLLEQVMRVVNHRR